MKYDFRRVLPRLVMAGLAVMAALGPVPSAAAAQMPQLNRQLYIAQVPYRNLLGWVIGGVTVTWEHGCVDCLCEFVGREPTIAETLAAYDCDVTVEATTSISCPPTAECPNGVIGQRRVVIYECCIAGSDQLPGGPYGCFSQIVVFETCTTG